MPCGGLTVTQIDAAVKTHCDMNGMRETIRQQGTARVAHWQCGRRAAQQDG